MDESTPNQYTTIPKFPRDWMGLVTRLLGWLQRQVQHVPADLAVCEFDCRQLDCRHGDWESCSRRLHPGVYPDSEISPKTDKAS